ncbi:MAG TPA: aminotransferase class V-fold PLP-dependent enzyme [Gammaproteobacteria bacterium]|nr:aminotransferase class V-fold PLP-dependent enzyme [Gammaproteobacteria bacterium]
MQTEFNLHPKLIYVNHAAVSPWPARTVEAVKNFACENGYIGSRHYEHWLKTEQQLKQSLAQLINAASADEIALLKNTSEGLSIIASGIKWQAGDNIVISDEEFPSNVIVWDTLKTRGVEVRIARLSEHTHNPEQAITEQMDSNTRLLSISAIQYASGRRMDLLKLGEACKAHSSLFCVDAIQQIGALQFDVQAINADFVVADGHKWMFGPEGLALFYCKHSSMDALELQQFGWHMVEDLSDFDAMCHQWQPADNARRFECGSQNMTGIQALNASVSLLLELDMEHIEKSVISNIQTLIGLFEPLKGIHILSPTEPLKHGGIFTFKKQAVDSQLLYQYLVSQGVVCAARGGGIRFSPHFYNSSEQLEQLADLVNQFD